MQDQLQPKNVDEAAEKYAQTLADLKEATILFCEKLAFYSAGIISLSLTFIGYVLSKSGPVLYQKSLHVPIYWYIFTAWGLFFVSLAVSLYYRIFAAEHLSRLFHGEWVELKAKDTKTALNEIESGEAFVNGISEEDLPGWLVKAKTNTAGYDLIIEKSKKSISRYNFISPLIRLLPIIAFLLGCIIFLFAAAQIILRIAKI